MPKLRIDGDILLYSALDSTAGDEVYIVGDSDTGIHVVRYEDEAELIADGRQITKTKEVTSFIMFEEKLQNYLDNLREYFPDHEQEIWLTKNPTFRHKIFKAYKANRSLKKPAWMNVAREYMLSIGGKYAPGGLEADDACCINLGDDVTVSNDKDFWMVPGKHFNLSYHETVVSKDPGNIWIDDELKSKPLRGTGLRWFCAQMLTGDGIDNIPGVKGIGKITALKLLKDVDNPLKTVYNIYMERSTEEHFQLMANLLWIWRKEDDLHGWEDYL